MNYFPEINPLFWRMENIVFLLVILSLFLCISAFFFSVEILSVYGCLCKMPLCCGSTFGNAVKLGCFLFVSFLLLKAFYVRGDRCR